MTKWQPFCKKNHLQNRLFCPVFKWLEQNLFCHTYDAHHLKSRIFCPVFKQLDHSITEHLNVWFSNVSGIQVSGIQIPTVLLKTKWFSLLELTWRAFISCHLSSPWSEILTSPLDHCRHLKQEVLCKESINTNRLLKLLLGESKYWSSLVFKCPKHVLLLNVGYPGHHLNTGPVLSNFIGNIRNLVRYSDVKSIWISHLFKSGQMNLLMESLVFVPPFKVLGHLRLEWSSLVVWSFLCSVFLVWCNFYP